MLGFTGMIWELLTAEENSGALNAGPGPVPATLAGEAWGEISAVFNEVAMEVQAASIKLLNNWQGIGADLSASKLTIFSAWLADIGAVSAADAAKSTAQATINTTARLLMPTEAEIATTRAVVKTLDILAESSDMLVPVLAGSVVGAPIAPFVPMAAKGMQAAGEALEKELDIRAALAMEGYESASTLTATVPTIFSLAPSVANGLALNPLNQIEQLTDRTVALTRGAEVDRRKVKTELKTLKTQKTEANAKEKMLRAKAENFKGNVKNVLENAKAVEEGYEIVKETTDSLLNVGKDALDTVAKTSQQVIQPGLELGDTVVKNIAGVYQQGTITPTRELSSNLSMDRLGNKPPILKVSPTASKVTGVDTSKNISLKGKTFNLAKLNPLEDSGEINSTLLADKNASSKASISTTPSLGGVKSDKKSKRKKSTNKLNKSSEYNKDLLDNKIFKLQEKVAPKVIGDKDK